MFIRAQSGYRQSPQPALMPDHNLDPNERICTPGSLLVKKISNLLKANDDSLFLEVKTVARGETQWRQEMMLIQVQQIKLPIRT